jgi:hypothetical protein
VGERQCAARRLEGAFVGTASDDQALAASSLRTEQSEALGARPSAIRTGMTQISREATASA